MRFPVWSHSANPEIDLPIIYKSRSYCSAQVEEQLAYWLHGNRGIQAYPPPNDVDEGDEDVPTREDSGAISFSESIDNAMGSADKNKRWLYASELRAMRKVNAYR